MTASASANEVCSHPNIKQHGETIDHWPGSHKETFVESAGSVTCTYYHWVDKVTWMCQDCGKNMGSEIYHHERHSICGKEF